MIILLLLFLSIIWTMLKCASICDEIEESQEKHKINK